MLRQLSPARVALVGLFAIAVIGVLAIGRSFFAPVVGATMLAMVLAPLAARLETLRVPRTLAALIVVAVVVAVLFVGVEMLIGPLARLLDELPTMRELLDNLTRLATHLFGPTFGAWLKARFAELAAQQTGTMSASLFTNVAGASVGLGTVFLLTFFLLASGDMFLQKLLRVLPRIRDKVNAVRIVRAVQEEISHYFLTVTLIYVGLGTLTGLICWYFGLPNALLWGAIVAVFEFVPYVGPLASFTLISVASVAHFWNISQAIVVPALFACAAIAEGQLITPMIVGRRVALNPVVVFVGLMFWAWLWGVAGMVLAVPMMLVAKIWAQNTQALAQWSEFLGPNTNNGNGNGNGNWQGQGLIVRERCATLASGLAP